MTHIQYIDQHFHTNQATEKGWKIPHAPQTKQPLRSSFNNYSKKKPEKEKEIKILRADEDLNYEFSMRNFQLLVRLCQEVRWRSWVFDSSKTTIFNIPVGNTRKIIGKLLLNHASIASTICCWVVTVSK